MPLLVNLRHLANHEVALNGELSPADLQMESQDEMIQVRHPLEYDLEAEKVNDNLLVHGRLRIILDCRCVRCLEPFQHEIALDGPLCDLPLQGEEAVAIVNDCVDLTPHLRDDIFLEFPSHPLCKPECGGLSVQTWAPSHPSGATPPGEGPSSVWDQLNKLKC